MQTVSKTPGRVAVLPWVVTPLVVLLILLSPVFADERGETPQPAADTTVVSPTVDPRGEPTTPVTSQPGAENRRANPPTMAKAAPLKRVPRKVFVGRATWYGPGFHGRRTASGERFNRHALTLASRSLPMRTVVRVTNLRTGRSAIGRVNDRGPFGHGAVVDLSEALARRVGMLNGAGRVRVEVLGRQ